MGLLRRKMQLAAKVESTKGTAETLTASEAGILCETLNIKVNRAPVARNPLQAKLSKVKSIPGIATGTIDCRVEVKGSGTAATPPSWGVLLRGCGLSQTIATNVTYQVDSDDADSATLTMAVMIDGKKYQMYGARGNAVLTAVANEFAWWDFTFTGIWDDDTDTAMFTGVTYESTTPPQFRASSTTFNFGTSWSSSVYSTLRLDLGNVVSLRSNANSTSGIAYAQITDRDPNGTIDIDTPLVAAQDIYGHMAGATTGSLALQIGSAAGNQVALSAPALQIIDITETEREGIAVADVSFHLRTGASGDDELVITHS